MDLDEIKKYLITVCYVLLVACTAMAEPFPQFTIMTEDWEPYNFKKNGIVQGISTDMLVLMLEKVGSAQGRQDIRIYPWARAYQMILHKPNTLLFTTTRTQEREKMFKWVGPIFEMNFYIYALKKRHIKINTFEDLKQYRIGTLRGDVVEDLLVQKAGLQVSRFERVSSNIQNTKKLWHGRVDLIPQSRDTTLTTCKEAGLDPDTLEPVFVLDAKSMYYAFHPKTSDAVIQQFQEAFDEIKKQGTLTEIYHHYGK